MTEKDFDSIKKYLVEQYNLIEEDFIIFHGMGYYTTSDQTLANRISSETNGTILYKMPADPSKEFWTIRWWIER